MDKTAQFSCHAAQNESTTRSLPLAPEQLSSNTLKEPVNSSIILCLSASPQEVEKALTDIKQKKSALIDEINRLQNEISLCSTEIELLDANGFDEAIGQQRGNRTSQLQSKIMALGVRKFNTDPADGISYIVGNGLLANRPEEVALFLYREPKLNKTAIGNYLGLRDDFAMKVLNSFVALHDFQDIQLVEALRRFLISFRLPGEGQKIDRMMQAFSDRYQECNPNVFKNAEVVHILAYAVVILNTSLHNRAVSKSNKMSLDEFIRMVEDGLSANETGRAADGKEDQSGMPDYATLQIIYDSVRRQPFRLPDEDTTKAGMNGELAEIFFNPDKEGWMYKLGGNFRTWKRRWFILTGCCLYYFEFTTDKTPRGIIPLAGGLAVRNAVDISKPHCFEIYPVVAGGRIRARKTNDLGRRTEGNHSFYRFSAPSHAEKQAWMQALRTAMENVSIEAQPGWSHDSAAQ